MSETNGNKLQEWIRLFILVFSFLIGGIFAFTNLQGRVDRVELTQVNLCQKQTELQNSLEKKIDNINAKLDIINDRVYKLYYGKIGDDNK